MAKKHNLHIGQMIKAVFDKSGMSVSELARRINTTRSNVYFIFERPSIDVEKLMEICKALEHNFFDDIQVIGGMKSTLCPREFHISLNTLDDDKAKLLADLLQTLNGKTVCDND